MCSALLAAVVFFLPAKRQGDGKGELRRGVFILL